MNRSRSRVELVSVEVEELHENLTQVVLGNHGPTLNLRHILQQTYDETSDRETANTSIDGFVQTSHGQQVLDQRDQYWHSRELSFPVLERLVCNQASLVLE